MKVSDDSIYKIAGDYIQCVKSCIQLLKRVTRGSGNRNDGIQSEWTSISTSCINIYGILRPMINDECLPTKEIVLSIRDKCFDELQIKKEESISALFETLDWIVQMNSSCIGSHHPFATRRTFGNIPR
jgi:hypothetical protein